MSQDPHDEERPNYFRSLRILMSWCTGLRWEKDQSLWNYVQRMNTVNSVRMLVALPVIIALYGLMFYISLPYIESFFAYLIRIWNPQNSKYIGIGGICLSIVVGLALSEFKRRMQWLYGLVEISVSCASCFYTFQKVLETKPTILGIVAPIATAIYFTQRGFTNFFEGLKTRDKLK